MIEDNRARYLCADFLVINLILFSDYKNNIGPLYICEIMLQKERKELKKKLPLEFHHPEVMTIDICGIFLVFYFSYGFFFL